MQILTPEAFKAIRLHIVTLKYAHFWYKGNHRNINNFDPLKLDYLLHFKVAKS